MKVKDVMRKNYFSFQANDDLEFIIKNLVKKNITSAPVFDGNDLLGIIDDLAIVKYLSKKPFQLVWKKEKQTPIERMKKTTAQMIVKRPKTILKPDQELAKVLSKIVSQTQCIPVIDKKQLVGIVRSQDMTKFFMKEFAKYDFSSESKSKNNSSKGMSTVMDKMLFIIDQQGGISSRELSKKLNISVKTVEELGDVMKEHHLIRVKYSFLKGPEFRRIDHEEK